MGQGFLAHFTKLTDATTKDGCAQAIAEVIVKDCHELQLLKIEEFDIEDGIEQFTTAQANLNNSCLR